MRRIIRIGRGVVRWARAKELCDLTVKVLDADARTELIQPLIILCLWYMKEILEQGVKAFAGERYKRKGLGGYDRWGKQWVSVYLMDQKVPILAPRVMDR